jgi:hypothetical protein
MIRKFYVVVRRLSFIGLLLSLCGCSFKGRSLTHYQVPAEVLKSFRTTHPTIEQVEFSSFMKDGAKLFQAAYEEDGEMHEVQYNVHGVVFVPKAEKHPKPEPQAPSEEAASDPEPSSDGETPSPAAKPAVVPEKKSMAP